MQRVAKIDRLLEVLAERIFQPVGSPVPVRFRRASPEERGTVPTQSRDDWTPATPDLVWGEPEAYFWFGGEVVVPAAAAGRRLAVRIEAAFGATMGRSDPQCLVRVDGKVVQGGDGNHREVFLTDNAVEGARYDILIEAGTIENRRQLGLGLTLLVHDPLAEKVYYDLKVPLDVARHLKADDARRHAVLNLIDEALALTDLRPGNLPRFHESLRAAEAVADKIYALADTEAMPTIVAAGHTHIDVAWLWRVRETRQKMARSMATALRLMEEYPDYRFMYNQGYLFETLSEDYPELFERLREQVRAGRFEVEGALWLEPDVNIASGESLVRHIMRGVDYHKKTFGVRARLLWLPDTFGYSAALPQIMRKSGLTTFVTHKMSWNDTNRMPAEAFHWRGVDGSSVPTSFITTQRYESDSINTTYCADLLPSHVMGTWKRHSQQADMPEMFLIYGHGDGGGGPTRRMVENIRRMERGIPGCPKVRHDALMGHFDRLAERMEREPGRFPSWVGELYFEYHRGTLTSVAKNKRSNRLAEIKLRELELLEVLTGTDIRADLDALWRIVLLNQFHDILPGSGYGPVYDDSDADYARFFETAAATEGRLADALGGAAVLNAVGRERSGLVELDAPKAQTIHSADGSVREMLPVSAVPALSLHAVTVSDAAPGPLSVSPTSLENAKLKVEFDGAGRVSSLFDKTRGREVLKSGQVGNRLVAYQDYPLNYDAWDIGRYYEEKSWEVDTLISATVVETGPFRAAIRLEWAYESSRVVQVVSLEADADRVEIDTFVDWRERHTLLKSLTPVDVNTTEVRAEIQFGHVRRPTHRNTSWDQARFESSMHRWIDLSEPGFGLAVLNDCKYGFDAHDNVVRLSLLRSPTYPWPEADQGEHRFRYALMPHGGAEADLNRVVAAAEDFNIPLRVIGSGPGAARPARLFAPRGDGVAVETVKRAEDGDGYVVRLYETRGRRTSFTLGGCFARAEEVDLLEENAKPAALSPEGVRVELRPFEIVTLKLEARA